MTVLTKRRNLSKTKTMYKSKSKTKSKKSKNISKSRKILRGGEKLISDELKNMKGGGLKDISPPKGSMSTGSISTGSMRKMPPNPKSKNATRPNPFARTVYSVPNFVKPVYNVPLPSQLPINPNPFNTTPRTNSQLKLESNKAFQQYMKNGSVLPEKRNYISSSNGTPVLLRTTQSIPNILQKQGTIKGVNNLLYGIEEHEKFAPVKKVQPTIPFLTMHNTSIPIIYDKKPYTEINVNTGKQPNESLYLQENSF